MSTLAGPAVAAYPVLNAEQRRSLIQRVSNVVNERIWDPAFQAGSLAGCGRPVPREFSGRRRYGRV